MSKDIQDLQLLAVSTSAWNSMAILKTLGLYLPPLRRLHTDRNSLATRVMELEAQTAALTAERNRLLMQIVDLESSLSKIEPSRSQSLPPEMDRTIIQEISREIKSELHLASVQSSNIEDTICNFRTEMAIALSQIEFQCRDIVNLHFKPSNVPKLNWTISTERSLAINSDDHRFPRGTKNDNTRHPRFVRACENIFSRPVTHLDLGCAGGGLVWDFTLRGHQSVGVEGSDFNKKELRAEWRTIADRLFTADICYPFSFNDETGSQVQFDIISAWELLEHIPEHLLPKLFENIARNLRPGGYFVASIATFEDRDDATGAIWHQTVKPKTWWETLISSHPFRFANEMFTTLDFVRGSGNRTAHDWDVHKNPEMGFHIVLQSTSSHSVGL